VSVLQDIKLVKLFFSVFSRDEERVLNVVRGLSDMYGAIDHETPVIKFEYTDYYQNEFGTGIVRKLFSLKDLIDPAKVVGIKIKAVEMETEAVVNGQRTVNIDPGYVELSRVVLTTGKDYSHRIYLDKGVYADLTLTYRKGSGFVTLPWTYPDYASDDFRSFFGVLRSTLKGQLKERKID
jgi:hypothetical protein